MKLIFVFLGIVLYLNCSHSQTSYNVRGEFATQSNGLMYSDKDMKVLRYIVDSLNLRFRKCEFNREFFSYPQGQACTVEFESKTNSLKSVIEDLRNSIGFYEILKKYKQFIKGVDSSQLISQYSDQSFEGKLYFLHGTAGKGYDYLSFPFDQVDKSAVKKWAYEYYEKGEYHNEYSLDVHFFPDGLSRKRIPSAYSRLLEYVDCMIDTNATVMLAGYESKQKEITSLSTLTDYIQSKLKTPVDSFDLMFGNLITTRQADYAMKHLGDDAEFMKKLNEVTDECIKAVRSDPELERLAEAFISEQKALTLKRSRFVMGQCSQDESPRLHALDIAKLAAESHSWDIFLRSHLNIMNDRFARMSDGSYAWDGRKTYLKELEELDLNIVDLMLGLTLRASNLPDNHYYGTIWRMGWALTESREQERFQEAALEMMKNKELDELNRGLIFLLYSTYLYRLEDTNKANILINNFKNSAGEFPSSLQPYISQLKLPETKKGK